MTAKVSKLKATYFHAQNEKKISKKQIQNNEIKIGDYLSGKKNVNDVAKGAEAGADAINKIKSKKVREYVKKFTDLDPEVLNEFSFKPGEPKAVVKNAGTGAAEEKFANDVAEAVAKGAKVGADAAEVATGGGALAMGALIGAEAMKITIDSEAGRLNKVGTEESDKAELPEDMQQLEEELQMEKEPPLSINDNEDNPFSF